jgi:uncharacterized membrane protein YfcA
MDAVSGITLTCVYAFHDKINYKMGLIHGGIGCVVAVICCLFNKWILILIEDLLKNVTGIIVIIVGVVFVIRGIGRQYQEYKEKMNRNNTEGYDDVHSDRKGSQNRDVTKQNSSSSDKDTQPRIDEVIELEDDIDLDLEDGFQISFQRQIIAGIASAVSGALSGVIGIGGGMNYVLIFLGIAKMGLQESTATGTLIMGMLMVVIGLMYLIVLPIHPILWTYVAAGCASTFVGSLAGAFLLIKIPKVAINYLVGVLLIGVGLYATIQAYNLVPVQNSTLSS